MSSSTLVDKATSGEANSSLLLYFPPACAVKGKNAEIFCPWNYHDSHLKKRCLALLAENPAKLLAGDLPLAPAALEDEIASIKTALSEAETALLKAQMDAETLSK